MGTPFFMCALHTKRCRDGAYTLGGERPFCSPYSFRAQAKGKQEPNGKGVHIAPADGASVRRRCILGDNFVLGT